MKSINVDNRMNRACLIASGLLTLILFLNPRTGRSDQLAGGANHGRALRPHSAESLSDDPSAEEITGCQVFSGPLIMNQGQMPVAAENAAL